MSLTVRQTVLRVLHIYQLILTIPLEDRSCFYHTYITDDETETQSNVVTYFTNCRTTI